jgi:hypothetical protein
MKADGSLEMLEKSWRVAAYFVKFSNTANDNASSIK